MDYHHKVIVIPMKVNNKNKKRMNHFLFLSLLINPKKVSQSNNTLKLMEKEIELKKIAMVEKDLENKRLMENPIKLPVDQQEHLTQIRDSTSEVRNNVGYLHSEINERLARLEAQTELKKLERMLKEIEEKENKLNKK